MTIVRTINTAFAGGNAATLPILAHASGFASVANRWLAKTQTSAAAAAPIVGTLSLTATGAPTLVTDEYGQKAWRTNGVDSTLGTTALSGIATVTVVARVAPDSSATKGIVHLGGAGSVQRTTAGTTRVQLVNNSAMFAGADTAGPKYHVISMVNQAAGGGRYMVDGVSGEAAAANVPITEVTIGKAGSTTLGQVDALEIITSTVAHSAAQLGTIYSALKAYYGSSVIA